MSSQSGLLRERRFLPLFVTQFLGALNDNVLKNALVVLLTFQAANWTSLAPELLANLAMAIFILPFFLFSATSGQLADKYDKARLARLVKLLEMGIMLVAGIGFALHSLTVLFLSLFLLGSHSTLFGPIKYAILPQHLHPDELVGGNALIEAGTFVAILIGTLLGGVLAGLAGGETWTVVLGLAVAGSGYLASRGIPSAPAPSPALRVNWNPLVETWRNIRFARETRALFLSILGISWFWLYGALFLAQFPSYAKNVLGSGESGVTLLLATFTVGIGVGSLLCERLSAKQIELGLVPFGSIGLSLFGLDLAFATPPPPSGPALDVGALLGHWTTWRVLADLTLLGAFGGFFIVPLYALLQQRSSETHRARMIAANNIVNALFMVVGALGASALLAAGVGIPTLFGIAALCNGLVALYIYGLVPEFLVRFLVWILVHFAYRVEVRGLERLPAQGGAIILCQSGGLTGALLALAACPRPIRLVADPRWFRGWLGRYLFRASGAIPLPVPANSQGTWDLVAQALADGDLVGLFLDGDPRAYPDLAALLDRAGGPPVLPLALSGVENGRRPALFSRLGLTLGAPVPGAEQLRELVLALAAGPAPDRP